MAEPAYSPMFSAVLAAGAGAFSGLAHSQADRLLGYRLGFRRREAITGCGFNIPLRQSLDVLARGSEMPFTFMEFPHVV